jgi:hypothetical protein
MKNTKAAAGPRRRRRVLLLRTAICLFSLLVALTTAEVVTRLLEGLDPGFNRYFFKLVDHGEKFVYDPDLGWRNAPEWSLDEPNLTITINSHGLRGPERAYAKPAGVRRILILGDSYTFGYGVNDDETYPAYLETKLQAEQRPFQVINMGVNAYGTDQEYLTLLKEGTKYDPDIVVLAFFTENDFADNLNRRLDVVAKPYFMDETLRPANVPVPFVRQSAGKTSLVHPSRLIHASALYRLLFFAGVSSERSVRVMQTLNLCDVEPEKPPDFQGDWIDLAVAITQGISKVCAENDAQLAVMSFGGFLDGPFNQNYPQAASEFTSRLRQRVPDLHFLDLDQAFVEKELSTARLTEGISYNHWNAFAHQTVAAILYDFLQHERLLTSERSTGD